MTPKNKRTGGIKYDTDKPVVLIPKEVVVNLYGDMTPLHGMIKDSVCSVVQPERRSQWRLIAIAMAEEVMQHGAKKYGANNWQGLPDFEDRYFAASIRHLTAVHQGLNEEMSMCLQSEDKDSGILHVKHFVCNCVFLMWKEIHS